MELKEQSFSDKIKALEKDHMSYELIYLKNHSQLAKYKSSSPK